MATKALNNPFSGFGKIVSGERFIGRNDQINIIRQRVLGSEYSNLSITGLPKIGKSSLVWQCLVHNREIFASNKTIVVYYQIGSTRSSLEFFKKLVFKTDEEIQDLFESDEKYQKFCLPLIKDLKGTSDIENVTDIVEKYFKKLRRWGYKIIMILDEFDHAQDIFELADFQELREISYEPETKICLITCSRKTLDEIETKDGKLSNFARIFSDCQLKMFSNNDVTLYWERVKGSFDIDNNHKILVKYLVGNHPWLMDVVNDYYYMHKDDNLSIDDKFNGVKLPLMQGLDDMVSTLEKEHLLNAAIQLVIGPYYDVTLVQIEKLLLYGFIKKVSAEEKAKLFGGISIGPIFENNSSYVCFSDYCTLDLYRRYYADIPYVKIWSETETDLRNLIKTYLSERYSSDWENEMRTFLTNNLPYRNFNVSDWSSNVQRLKNNMNDMISNFPTMRGNHIVDFTLTSQIFNIFIKWDWAWFGSVFTGQKMEWHNKFDHLTKVRNPVAHNNPGDLRAEMEIARTFCSDIKNAIQTWEKNRYKNATQEPL